MDELTEEQADIEEEADEEETTEDIAIDNQAKIDALIELLVSKGVITEEEFDKSYENQFEQEE
jgi:hypothetical protein